MRFVLEVEMGDPPFDGEGAKELGRILRYWGGSLARVPIEVGAGSAIYDSAYREVGAWRIIGTPADLEEPITPDGAAE